jgi:hypothetical protein
MRDVNNRGNQVSGLNVKRRATLPAMAFITRKRLFDERLRAIWVQLALPWI